MATRAAAISRAKGPKLLALKPEERRRGLQPGDGFAQLLLAAAGHAGHAQISPLIR
jgi:uncharacterized protein (DUF2237 family)